MALALPGRLAAAVAAAGAAVVAAGTLVAVAATPPPAHLNNTVGLKQVGPIDEANDYPLWYKDTNDRRLELCTDPNDAFCIMGEVPDPLQPVKFPTNFPDEAFWSSAEASLTTNAAGEKALLVTAVEAAFDTADGKAAKGHNVSFGRIRIRAAGVLDGQTYKVTHPYGTDTLVAETGLVKGLNSTEDVGNLVADGTFDQTLAARSAPFLSWSSDLNTLPQLPNGTPAYLGDPNTPHAVTGSPYGTNFFRIEGPAGSFPGSPNLCTDATLGASATATDDCVETRLFNVQGKVATRAGVEVTKAVYADKDAGQLIDLFAFSEPGQRLIITGTGISQTEMRGDAGGKYFGRVFVDGPPPADLAVTNVSDSPRTVDTVPASMFGDKVHITSAVYDNDVQRLTVTAQSGDDAASLTLQGYTPTTTSGGGAQPTTWTVDALRVPPADIVVVSSKGGIDSDDVVVTGAAFAAAQVVAAVSAAATDIQVNQQLTLDATGSTGTISKYTWTQDSGPAAASITPSATTPAGQSATISAATTGTYVFRLRVEGTGVNNIDEATIAINVAASAAPEANAGADQVNIVPTATVTLDGTASKFATSYQWTGPVTLSRPDTANPTFVMPVTTSPTTYTFTLTVTSASGQTAADTVAVTNNPDNLGVDEASYKAGSLEWRVRGTAEHCSANNTVTVIWNKPVTGGTTPVTLGTVTPAGDLGVCSFDFRLRNTPSSMRPTSAGTITVRSALGGVVNNRTFQLL